VHSAHQAQRVAHVPVKDRLPNDAKTPTERFELRSRGPVTRNMKCDAVSAVNKRRNGLQRHVEPLAPVKVSEISDVNRAIVERTHRSLGRDRCHVHEVVDNDGARRIDTTVDQKLPHLGTQRQGTIDAS
jgi:hypothetical protein